MNIQPNFTVLQYFELTVSGVIRNIWVSPIIIEYNLFEMYLSKKNSFIHYKFILN